MVFITQDASASNQPIGSRNRIINGAMNIDQRNVGVATALPSGSTLYGVDRMRVYNGLANATTTQQVTLGAGGAPPIINSALQFTSALQWTNSSTATSATTATVQILQGIEGGMLNDLMWGTTSARSVTLQFWAYASVAGPYSLVILNNGSNYNYNTSYTLAANTWQKVVLTIPGAPSGTWPVNTSALNINLSWNLHGSTASGATSTLNSWVTSGVISSTQTNIGQTASSVFALTGVQLEVGIAATAFEWRPLETEMRMCQRYYEKSYDYSAVVGSVTNLSVVGNYPFSNGNQMPGITWKVEKRIAPTSATIYSPNTANTMNAISTIGGSTNFTTALFNTVGSKGALYITNLSGLTTNTYYIYHYIASADF